MSRRRKKAKIERRRNASLKKQYIDFMHSCGVNVFEKKTLTVNPIKSKAMFDFEQFQPARACRKRDYVAKG